MRTSFLTLSALSLFSSACDLSAPPEDAIYQITCNETVTVLGQDDLSALGFSPAEVLTVVEGSHSAPLFWQDGAITAGPESGEGMLVVDVTYAGGEIRYVESTPDSEGGEEGFCTSRLEIEAEIGVHTEGGGLSESFTTTLEAVRPEVAFLSHTLDIDDLQGSFEVLATDPEDGETTSIDLGIGISSFGVFGSFDGTLEHVDGEFASAILHNYATFPSDGLDCEFPVEAPVPVDSAWGGHSVTDALALVNASSDLVLSWGGDSPTPDEPSALAMEVSPVGAVACGRIAAGEPMIFPVALKMKSDSGRIDGVLELEAQMELDGDGNLEQVSIQHDSYDDIIPVGEFGERFGVHGVDFAEFESGAMTLDLTADAEGIFGAITVLGVTTPDCSDEDGVPCEGVNMTELIGGTWASSGE